MPYIEADRLTGTGIKQFISDMMPRYPLYVSMLPKEAQAVIDKVHKDTEPALAMLEREGFRSHGYIDIFEAGPMVECELSKIKSIRKSSKHTIDKIVSNLGSSPNNSNKKEKYDNLYLISTTSLDFRVCIGKLNYNEENDEVTIAEDVAEALNVNKNNHIRFVPLKFLKKPII